MSEPADPNRPIEEDPLTAAAIDDEAPAPALAPDTPGPDADPDVPLFRDGTEPELAIRTGSEQEWDPEDYAVAQGWDPTPKNVERARRELAKLGPAAIEKTVP
jgi:hypothetical protein